MEGKTKHDRKITKKQHRYQSVLLNETSIQHSESPMQYMMLCNAGLVSGIQYEDVVNVFSKFGSVERVVMIPGKSYCFVIYHDVEAAKIAYEKLNGIMKLEKMDGPMYLLFCQEVPEIKSAVSLGILPDGLTLIEDFVTEEEEEKLLACVHWDEMNDHLGKIMKHRRVKHYGFEFRYDNNNVDKDKPLSEKIPEECLFINKRFEEKGYGTLLPWTPDQLTVNQYQKGQGIPSHIDTHSAFESPIMSLSLSSDVVMEFKSVGEHIPVFLPRRSMLVMDGPARYAWSHGITPRTMDVISVRGGLTVQERSVRTSFTFRRIRQSECCCSYHQYCNIWSPEKVSEDIASKLEAIHVHEVYDTIALHFSDTRSKIWPNVRTFIESFAAGSILVDVGCGNGKYFGVNQNIFQVGCDHSKGLATVTYDRGHEVFICNCLQLPLRSNIADGVISIAVLHHLSTEERRFQALQEIVRVLRPGGKALIYVWAKNQSRSKMSAYLKQDRKNRRNQGDGIKDGIQNSKIKQETMVSCDTVLNNAENILNFKNLNIPENEICNDKVVNTLSQSTTVSFDKSKLSVNLPVHINRTEFQHHDLLVPWKMKSTFCKEKTEKKEDQMFLRYYHVFEEGEIDEVCSQLLSVNINRTYYDEGNWCIILEKVEN